MRRLDEIVRELLDPLFHARPTPNGWRLAGWDSEQGVCVLLARQGEWVLVELEDLDASRPCHSHTQRFNVYARYQFDPSRPLSVGASRAVDQLVELIRRREGALPVIAPEPIDRPSEVREIEVDRVLMPQAPGHYYLNAYVGCMIGCEFCYVAERAALSRRLEGRATLPWGRYVDVKINAPEVLAREMASTSPGFVRMSPILTDPYQPLEKRYRITRRCVEAMVGTGFVPVVLTRAGRVREDAALYASIPRAAVGVSIPTDDDAIRRAFEPGGDPIDERIEALEVCKRAGVTTVAVIQPMLPMDPDALAARLAPHVRAVRIDRMHQTERMMHLYERAGCPEAANDAFFARTQAALERAFVERGVSIDPLDDLGGVLA